LLAIVIGLFTIAGFSQQDQQKAPETMGRAVAGQLDLDTPDDQTSFVPATVAWTGEFGVPANMANAHYLGYVHPNDVVDVWVRGMSGFDPTLMLIRANSLNNTVSNWFNDDSGVAPTPLDSHLRVTATAEGVIMAVVRGYAGRAGNYKLVIDMQ